MLFMTTRYSENIYYCTLALLLVVMVMSSCNPGKHLLEGQSILEENKLKLKVQDKIENEWLLKNELKSFITQ